MTRNDKNYKKAKKRRQEVIENKTKIIVFSGRSEKKRWKLWEEVIEEVWK